MQHQIWIDLGLFMILLWNFSWTKTKNIEATLNPDPPQKKTKIRFEQKSRKVAEVEEVEVKDVVVLVVTVLVIVFVHEVVVRVVVVTVLVVSVPVVDVDTDVVTFEAIFLGSINKNCSKV